MSFTQNSPASGLPQISSTNNNYGACDTSNTQSLQRSSMTSRSGYDAATPNYADFNIPHTPLASSSTPSAAGPSENRRGSVNGRPMGKLPPGYLGIPADDLDEDGNVVRPSGTLHDHDHDDYTTTANDGPLARCCSTTPCCKTVKKLEMFVKDNAGLLLVTGSQMFLSMVNVAVKELNSVDPPVPILELVWVRMLITWVFSTGYMYIAKVEHPILGPPGVRRLLLFRGFMGFLGLFGVYFSLQYLSLSDATVLTFLAPLCTAGAGALFLREKFTRNQALAGLISLAGVVLIARPSFIFGGRERSPALPGVENMLPSEPTASQRSLAVGVALVGVLGATGAYTTIRAIGKRMHPLHSLAYYSVQCVLFSTIGMIITKTQIVIPTKPEWLFFLACIGVLGFFAQVLLTMGLQRETAGRGSMAVYTQIVFATILQRIFFGTLPSALSVLGTFMILGAGIWVLMTKEQAVKPKPSVKLREVTTDSELERGLLEAHENENQDMEPKAAFSGNTRENGYHTAPDGSSSPQGTKS